MVVARGWAWGEGEVLVEVYKLALRRLLSSEDSVCSMVTAVRDAGLQLEICEERTPQAFSLT